MPTKFDDLESSSVISRSVTNNDFNFIIKKSEAILNNFLILTSLQLIIPSSASFLVFLFCVLYFRESREGNERATSNEVSIYSRRNKAKQEIKNIFRCPSRAEKLFFHFLHTHVATATAAVYSNSLPFDRG